MSKARLVIGPNAALVPIESEKAHIPDPATVLTVRVDREIRRIRKLPSAKARFEEPGSIASPTGLFNNALVPTPSAYPETEVLDPTSTLTAAV